MQKSDKIFAKTKCIYEKSKAKLEKYKKLTKSNNFKEQSLYLDNTYFFYYFI